MLQERHSYSLKIKLDRWLFNNGFKIDSLEVFSKVYVIFSLFIFGIGDMFGSSFQLFVSIPDFFFNPPLSIVRLFNGFPDYGVAIFLDILMHVLFGLVFFSIRPGINLFLIFLLKYLSNSFGFSFGKIDHNIISLILPLILAIGYLLKSKKPPRIGFINPTCGDEHSKPPISPLHKGTLILLKSD